MHITDLHIDRFGIWRDLTLPLGGPGLNVLYGPNEAGKTTLMRFVKAALYGGEPPRADNDALQPGDVIVASGSVRLTRDGKAYTIRRQLTAAGEGQVRVVGPDETPLPPETLLELLSGTSEAVFDRVFSVDLYELQELATLDHEELAGHVYGLSLGARGRRLLSAVDDLRRKRVAILSHDGRQGELATLLGQEQALLAEFRQLPDLPTLQADLLRQRDGVDSEVAALKRRRGDLQHELRGRRFLDRVHPAWRQVRDYRSELSKLAPTADLPPDGLAQLDGLDRESESLARKRDERRRQADEAKRRADAAGADAEIVRAEPAVRAMLGMRDWVKETIAARQVAADGKRTAAAAVKPVDVRVLAKRADVKTPAVEATPQGQFALLEAARGYRTAVGRRAEMRKRYRRLHDSTAKREAAVEERLASLGKTPDAAAAELRRRLASLETLAELRAKEAAFAHRGKSLRDRLEHLAETLDIPPWVTFVLAVFALGGAVFAVLGLITGVTTSVIGGIAYLLLGLTCGIIAVKLRAHFEVVLKETAERVRDERRAEEVELRKVREEIARLAGVEEPTAVSRSNADIIPLASARKGETPSFTDSIRDAVKQFAGLDEIVSEQDHIRRRRKLLTSLRARLRNVQQASEAARQNWCQTLVQNGLDETLDVEDALAAWQRSAEANAVRATVDPAERDEATFDREHSVLDGTLRAFGGQLEAMGRRINVWNGNAHQPLEVLADWEKALDAGLRRSVERKKHIDEYKRAKQEAAEADDRIKELGRQRTALLAAAGVKSRADYERRLAASEQRRELEELLSLAETELETIASAEPELAIVEEDLRAFRPNENDETLKRLAHEQEELEAKLEAALERRGHLARRLDELAADERATTLRRRKTVLDVRLRETAERLLATTIAERAAEQARAVYERDHQPPVLAAASESLARLTRNRYTRIWSPLGERGLRIDDDHGRTFTVEQLSGGTREQLFLALRLGLVRHAAERGVRLPLILDDVFVNFDQLRTEAAFETLRDFADEGRQVLFFTCHLHLAHLAEHRGIDPIWLPGHQPPMQQRLAG